MIFTESKLKGAYMIEPQPIEDKRGYFAVGWTKEEFERHGLNGDFLQQNISYNKHAGTLRGMHSQKHPYGEEKLVRCVQGAIYDVIVDIRPDSPTYLEWDAVELTEENLKMLYIPKGFLHGFQTLRDDSVVLYQVTEYFHPEAALGARYDDPAFQIRWPEATSRVISDKDKAWPLFDSCISQKVH